MEIKTTDTKRTALLTLRLWRAKNGYEPDCFSDLNEDIPMKYKKDATGAYLMTGEQLQDVIDWWKAETKAANNCEDGQTLNALSAEEVEQGDEWVLDVDIKSYVVYTGTLRTEIDCPTVSIGIDRDTLIDWIKEESARNGGASEREMGTFQTYDEALEWLEDCFTSTEVSMKDERTVSLLVEYAVLVPLWIDEEGNVNQSAGKIEYSVRPLEKAKCSPQVFRNMMIQRADGPACIDIDIADAENLWDDACRAKSLTDYVGDIGWAEWMEAFTTATDGEAIEDCEIESIDKFLKTVWDAAHPGL